MEIKIWKLAKSTKLKSIIENQHFELLWRNRRNFYRKFQNMVKNHAKLMIFTVLNRKTWQIDWFSKFFLSNILCDLLALWIHGFGITVGVRYDAIVPAIQNLNKIQVAVGSFVGKTIFWWKFNDFGDKFNKKWPKIAAGTSKLVSQNPVKIWNRCLKTQCQNLKTTPENPCLPKP